MFWTNMFIDITVGRTLLSDWRRSWRTFGSPLHLDHTDNPKHFLQRRPVCIFCNDVGWIVWPWDFTQLDTP